MQEIRREDQPACFECSRGNAPLKMLETQPIRISIALVTRNRPESLRRTLKSLRRQTTQPWEIVLSDDSDDAFKAEVKAIAESFDCRYVEGPRRGLYANRNHSALACAGTHVRTMDDDHEFPAGHLSAVSDAVSSSPDSIWVIPEKTKVDNFHALQLPSQLGPSGYGYPPSDPGDCWSIADGCTVYPADIFHSGILMMEKWPFGQAYLEFGARLRFMHGRRCRLVNGTHVIHHFEPGLRQTHHRRIEGASAVYAALAFSWRYHPRLSNQLATLLRLALFLLKRGWVGWQSIRWGAKVYFRNHDRPAFGSGDKRPCTASLRP